jgi:hypothetical protein
MIDPEKKLRCSAARRSLPDKLRGVLYGADQNAHVVAKFADGTAAAYEHLYGKGSAMLLGTFAGQQNEAKPVAMHPLGEILAKWAGLVQPEWKAPALVELREMDGEKGKFGRRFLGHWNYAASRSSSGCTSSLPLVLLASR